MILISFIIAIVYTCLIGGFIWGFGKISEFKLKHIPAKTKFTVVIPFRNEAKHLNKILTSIKALNYPKHFFEIILVDDESEDNSLEIINNFYFEDKTGPKIQVISNERKTMSPKKDAITSAIKKATNNWIITTDADCKLPKYWLDSFDEYIQKTNAICIAAPVNYESQNSLLSQFQVLDILSLQGATIGGFGIGQPFMCNGANFAYKKSVFFSISGFNGNTDIASGDDIFLLEKVNKTYPKHLHYLKCKQAIVTTQPQSTWQDLLEQRIRWAAKTTAYNNWYGKLTGFVVLLMNLLLVTALALLLAGFVNFRVMLCLAFIKFNIDLLLIFKSALFSNQEKILKSYLSSFIIYPFFSIYAGCLSLFLGYKWKGRYFKK